MRRLAILLACLAGVACSIVLRAAPAPSAVTRIVSTSPSITETLFALGLGDRVVGVSKYCRVPAQVTALPKVGTFLKPDAELIARLRPDLVVIHGNPNGLEARLSGLGIRIVTVERGTLASVYSTIREIGTAVGVADRAEALVARLQAQLDRVRTEAARHPRRKVLVIVGRRPGTLSDIVAVGPDSYLNDVITIAGGTNVLGDPALPAYPRISMETVIRLAPDVIVDAADMGDSPEELARGKTATDTLWQRQTLVQAARSGGVHAATTDAFTVPGPRVVDAAEVLAGWLRPSPAARDGRDWRGPCDGTASPRTGDGVIAVLDIRDVRAAAAVGGASGRDRVSPENGAKRGARDGARFAW